MSFSGSADSIFKVFGIAGIDFQGLRVRQIRFLRSPGSPDYIFEVFGVARLDFVSFARWISTQLAHPHIAFSTARWQGQASWHGLDEMARPGGKAWWGWPGGKALLRGDGSELIQIGRYLQIENINSFRFAHPAEAKQSSEIPKIESSDPGNPKNRVRRPRRPKKSSPATLETPTIESGDRQRCCLRDSNVAVSETATLLSQRQQRRIK